jgi:hypothetical protein
MGQLNPLTIGIVKRLKHVPQRLQLVLPHISGSIQNISGLRDEFFSICQISGTIRVFNHLIEFHSKVR